MNVLTSQGQGVAEAIRSIGVSEMTYYRWRQEFGGLKRDQIKRLKELETLEKVVEKIDKISVFGGLEGVLKDLVKIQP